MPKIKKKTKRRVTKRKPVKRKKNKLAWLAPIIRKMHRKKHFAAMFFIVFIAWALLITAVFTKPNDDRAERLEAYMSARSMPVAENAKTFVKVADHYDLDWRLLPAIAIRESSGGKRMMNQNPFGWGSAKIAFETIDDAIWEVGRNLSGNNERTSKWYSTTSTYEKLWWYNGTVIASYPDEVIWIMEQF